MTPQPPAIEGAPPPVQNPPQPDPELERLRGEVRKSQLTIDELKRKLTAPPAPAAQPAPGNPPSPAELNRQFYQDPVRNSVDIARSVVDDAMRRNQGGQDTLVRVAKDTVRNVSDESRKIFERWEPEIQAMVDAAGPQFITNVTVWENALNFVKGKHMDEILEMRGQTPPPDPTRAPAVHIREGAGPAPASPRPASAPKVTELTVEEKHVAKKMGLTEEQYRNGKAHYEGQNDMQRDPIGPSSWDKPFFPGAYTPTFSTKELRKAQRAAREARK